MNGLVRQRTNQVEISDEGPRLGSRRWIEIWTAEAAGEEEDGESGHPCCCVKNPRRNLNVHGD